MATILTEHGATEVGSAEVAGEDLWLAAADMPGATGWTYKPEGLCLGDVCVAVPPRQADTFVRRGRVNVTAFWRHMKHPVLHDAAGTTWMLGKGADERARALKSLEAPDFTLPDLDGVMHSLSDYRGKRVFLMTWSSW